VDVGIQTYVHVQTLGGEIEAKVKMVEKKPQVSRGEHVAQVVPE
jgi:hypothetical protein